MWTESSSEPQTGAPTPGSCAESKTNDTGAVGVSDESITRITSAVNELSQSLGWVLTREDPPWQTKVTNQFVNSIKEISFLSEKFSVIILFSLGTILILGAVLLKFTSAEFITLVVAATLLLVLAYKGWREIIKEQQKLIADLMRQQYRAFIDQREATERLRADLLREGLSRSKKTKRKPQDAR